MRHLSLLSLLLAPCALAAQTPTSIKDAVESITPADVRTRIGILADDSMLGRATPSPQLELVASYVAREFRRFAHQRRGAIQILTIGNLESRRDTLSRRSRRFPFIPKADP